MDQYFNQMEKIVKERKTSSRIRFMLQDVIDLRLVGTYPVSYGAPFLAGTALTRDGALQYLQGEICTSVIQKFGSEDCLLFLSH